MNNPESLKNQEGDSKETPEQKKMSEEWRIIAEKEQSRSAQEVQSTPEQKEQGVSDYEREKIKIEARFEERIGKFNTVKGELAKDLDIDNRSSRNRKNGESDMDLKIEETSSKKRDLELLSKGGKPTGKNISSIVERESYIQELERFLQKPENKLLLSLAEKKDIVYQERDSALKNLQDKNIEDI